MKTILIFLCLITISFSVMSPASAEGVKKFKGPASLMVPQGNINGKLAPGPLSATCTGDNGDTCTCKEACWAGRSCGCTTADSVKSGVGAGKITLER